MNINDNLDQFIEEISPQIDFSNNRHAIKFIFDVSFARYSAEPDPAIKQSFIVSYPITLPSYGKLSLAQQARIHLQLSNGQIYCLELTGEVQAGISALPDVARRLQHASGMFCHDRILEDELAEIINDEPRNVRLNSSDCNESRCSLRLLQSPSSQLSPNTINGAINKICIALLGVVNARYSHHRVATLIRLVNCYFSGMNDAQFGALSFNSGLDREALALVDEFSPHLIQELFNAGDSWINRCNRIEKLCPRSLIVHNYFVSGDSQVDRNRRQAMSELPWLFVTAIVPHLYHLDHPAFDFDESDGVALVRISRGHAILKLIDSGAPLFAGLAEIFDVPRSVIKSTRHMNLQNSKLFRAESIHLYLALLIWVPTEKRPIYFQIAEEFEVVLGKVIEIIRSFFKGENDGPPYYKSIDIDLLEHPIPQKLVGQFLCTLIKKDVKQTHQALKRVSDEDLTLAGKYLSALAQAEEIRRPTEYEQFEVTYNTVACQNMQYYLDQVPMREIINHAKAWQKLTDSEILRFLERNGVGEITEWPTLINGTLVINEYSVVELSNQLLLEEEGRRLEHCVAIYWERCAQDASSIFSIVHLPTGQRTTLELISEKFTDKISIGSHYGFKNENPSPGFLELANQLVTLLNSSEYSEPLRQRKLFQRHAARIAIKREQFLEWNIGQIERIRRRAAWLTNDLCDS